MTENDSHEAKLLAMKTVIECLMNSTKARFPDLPDNEVADFSVNCFCLCLDAFMEKMLRDFKASLSSFIKAEIERQKEDGADESEV